MSDFIDPFTRVYRAIRQQLIDFQPLVDVKAGNIPDLSDQTFERFKVNVQPGDLPEYALLQDDFVLAPFGRNSVRSDFTQSYRLFVTIDKLQTVPINRLKMQVYAGLYQLGTPQNNGQRASDLGLPGLVDDWTIRGATDDAFGQKEWKRDTLRYLSALSIVVSMYMTRQELSTFGR